MREPLNRWVLIFILFVMMVAWNYLLGCAQIPEIPTCEKFSYGLMTHRGEQYIVLDQHNAAMLSQMVEGLSKGSCRLEN